MAGDCYLRPRPDIGDSKTPWPDRLPSWPWSRETRRAQPVQCARHGGRGARGVQPAACAPRPS
eukprot:3811351-Prymnesium_polylepis.1